MKTLSTLLFAVLLSTTSLLAQDPEYAVFDTLLNQPFIIDPTPDMLPAPTGFDQQWVNFDADVLPGKCVSIGDPTPGGWYYEGDLGSQDPNETNFAFTSCSYFSDTPGGSFTCANWLILPPVIIPDSFCYLSWKSLSFQGPAFLDGYNVMVSTTTNDIFENSFSDTLFQAASMIDCSDCGSLDLADYTFTPGYIHANGFTDPAYFYYDDNLVSNRGKFEPHTVDLSKYAGKSIYIAFLHNGRNDFLLQVDDILVVDLKTSGIWDPIAVKNSGLQLKPNPAASYTDLNWIGTPYETADIAVLDISGRLIRRSTATGQRHRLVTEDLKPGTYFVKLRTSTGISTARFIKL